MPKLTPGRALLTLTSLVTMTGAYFADWNETHIYNPDWPPHAKFHNAQTMSMGAALGLIGLYLLWVHRDAWSPFRLQVIVGAASVYWITQLSAILYPGTALVDGDWVPPFSHHSQERCWPSTRLRTCSSDDASRAARCSTSSAAHLADQLRIKKAAEGAWRLRPRCCGAPPPPSPFRT